MYDDAEPVSYEGVPAGVPVLSADGHEFGRLQRVLEIPEEDLFDGIEVTTGQGVRFVDRDQIAEITTRYVRCTLDDRAVASLPEPGGAPVYRADATADTGRSFKAWFGRTFRGGRWKQQT